MDLKNYKYISGPCVIENFKDTYDIAKTLKEIHTNLKCEFVFKGSYKKDWRSSVDSFRGLGKSEGLNILNKVKKDLHIPITTDISDIEDVEEVSNIVDIIQIPEYLCMKTSLLEKCAKTGLPINIKKGKGISSNMILKSVEKVKRYNENVIVTNRGSHYGYNDLIVDMRFFKEMKDNNIISCYDGTHSIQKPGLGDGISGGDRKYIETLIKSSIAAGANIIFLEVHSNPNNALCDSNCQYFLKDYRNLLGNMEKWRKFCERSF